MLTDDLPVSHAHIGILQEELYVILSIFRQIYILQWEPADVK